jgi:hypothetical protein
MTVSPGPMESSVTWLDAQNVKRENLNAENYTSPISVAGIFFFYRKNVTSVNSLNHQQYEIPAMLPS